MARTDQAPRTDRPTPARPPRRRLRHVHVVRSEPVSPNVHRVTLTGQDLADFRLGSPGGHVKLLLPPAGHVTVPIPDGPPGATAREDGPRPIVRTYTPRRFDPDTRELDLDFALHGAGAASDWAQLARPGDRAAIAGPGRGYDPDPTADWFLLAGDETAMPALLAITAALPAHARALLFLEVPTSRDAQAVASHAEVDLRVLPRRDAPVGHLLDPAVRAADLPAGDGRAWIAAEAGLVRGLRDHLVGERGFDRDRLVARGYWKRGEANHPDHDYATD